MAKERPILKDFAKSYIVLASLAHRRPSPGYLNVFFLATSFLMKWPLSGATL